jgi:hypothetical protein
MKYPTVAHVMEVTELKKPRLAEGAIETLKWLERGAPHTLDGLNGRFTFNMGEFISSNMELVWDDDSGSTFRKPPKAVTASCGTACCIAGAIYAFSKRMNGDRIHDRLGPQRLNSFFGLNPDDDLARLGNLSSELAKLFYVVLPGGEQHPCLDDISPASAAITLRKYLETGVTDWGHLNEA